jgi:hypothetical protein
MLRSPADLRLPRDSEVCPLCAHAPRGASWRAARARTSRASSGFSALGHGGGAAAPRTKRLLVPPF